MLRYVLKLVFLKVGNLFLTWSYFCQLTNKGMLVNISHSRAGNIDSTLIWSKGIGFQVAIQNICFPFRFVWVLLCNPWLYSSSVIPLTVSQRLKPCHITTVTWLLSLWVEWNDATPAAIGFRQGSLKRSDLPLDWTLSTLKSLLWHGGWLCSSLMNGWMMHSNEKKHHTAQWENT